MNTVAAFLGELSDTHKAVTALVGAYTAGITTLAVLYGFALAGVPEQTDENTKAIADLNDDFASLVCLLTLPNKDTMTPEAMIRECGL